jgi:thioredoxin 1
MISLPLSLAFPSDALEIPPRGWRAALPWVSREVARAVLITAAASESSCNAVAGRDLSLCRKAATPAARRKEPMSSSQVIEINDHNFEATVLAVPGPVLVDFTAAWCAPCRAIAPHVEAIAQKYAGLRVGKCDVDGNPAAAARFDVRSMPTLLLFKDGQPVGQIVGAAPRARIEALIEQQGVPAPIGA